MSKYKPSDFEKKEIEILDSISTLKMHGVKLNIPKEMELRIKHTTLFDGFDGLFKKLIKDAKTYFEYGCGKSTEYVFKYTKAKIYSVDTSKSWVDKVSLLDLSKNDRLNIEWIDVGELEDWGTPISFEKRINFRNYAECLFKNNVKPDLILIDGRFRILCFLISVKFSPLGTKILFDDYMNRKLYQVVEEISKPIDHCGRQALFQVDQKSKNAVTEDFLNSFQNVIL